MAPLRFHERMAGWISFDQLSYNQALLDGHELGQGCAYDLEIEIDDVEAFVADPRHLARATGTVHCDALGGELPVEDGWFNLFVDASADPAGSAGSAPGGGAAARHKRMWYRLFLRDGMGRPITLSGFKDLERGPNYDVWADTSRLLVRLLAGHLQREPEGPELTIATGVLHINHAGVGRMVASFRSGGPSLRDRERAIARFTELFAGDLVDVYRAPDPPVASDDFPDAALHAQRWQGHPPGRWHDLAGHPGLRRQILPFAALDGFAGTLHHIRGARSPDRGPVLLVHGCATRANMFYDAPTSTTLVDRLVDAGYDVWAENWRGSIDLEPREWTLDEAAAYDHPAAVAAVLGHTGSSSLKAVVHCQGSTSFTMAAVAGLLPRVTAVVSNAVSLHPVLTRGSLTKLSTLPRPASKVVRGLDAQWAIRPPAAWPHAIARWSRLIRRECDNPVCAMANYSFGFGPDVLWRHDLLSPEVHRWLSRDWGFCPFTFFEQMARCGRRERLVPVSGIPSLPPDLAVTAPRTEAAFTFLAGERNRCFLPESQRRSYEHFRAADREAGRDPGRHGLHVLPGYSHLDVFFGRRVGDEVFPVVLGALAAAG